MPDTNTRWSQRVTETSNALELEEGVFAQPDPKSIARSLKQSAEHSQRRRSDPFRSAMRYTLALFINASVLRLDQAFSRSASSR